MESGVPCNPPELDEMTLRRENIRVGYLDIQGHPFDVDTDDEADEAIRCDLATTIPGWCPFRMKNVYAHDSLASNKIMKRNRDD